MADFAKPTSVQSPQKEIFAPTPSTDANKAEYTRVDTPSEIKTKTEEFEQMLNEQQKVTELGVKTRGDTFDPAEDIAENAVFGQSGLARSL